MNSVIWNMFSTMTPLQLCASTVCCHLLTDCCYPTPLPLLPLGSCHAIPLVWTLPLTWVLLAPPQATAKHDMTPKCSAVLCRSVTYLPSHSAYHYTPSHTPAGVHGYGLRCAAYALMGHRTAGFTDTFGNADDGPSARTR